MPILLTWRKPERLLVESFGMVQGRVKSSPESAVSQVLRICEFGDLSVAYLLPAQKFSRILSRICWALAGFEIDEQIRDFLRIRFGLATQTASATSPLLAAALCGGRKTSR